MPTAPPTPRRWFQFRLGTTIVAITVLGIAIGKLGNEWRLVKQRKLALQGLSILPNQDAPAGFRRDIPEPPFWRRAMGDKAMQVIYLEPGPGVEINAKALLLKRLFPEATISDPRANFFTAPQP
jgi:hypothetical protein